MSTVIEGNFPDDENDPIEQVEVDATGQATVHPLHPETPNLVGLFKDIVREANAAAATAVDGLNETDLTEFEFEPDEDPSLRDLAFLAVQIVRSALSKIDMEDFYPLVDLVTADETDKLDLRSLLRQVEIKASIPALGV